MAMTFDNWYSIYHEEVEVIIDQYVNTIMAFSFENKYHVFDIETFNNRMRNMIYKKSISRFKGRIQYL